MVDPWFTHRNRHTDGLLVKLFHAQICMQNIDRTLSYDEYDLRYFTHSHFWVNQNNIMDFIDHLWCSDLIWTTWSLYGFCASTTTTKFGKPLLNHSIRWKTVWIIFIKLGLGFWWDFFTQKVVINHHTKFTFFHLCKKFGGWFLSDTVTCKLIYEVDSNFNRRGLKDGTCQQ